MPMRATTVRFSEDLWALLEGEAAREGVSAAHFVRDATVMRIAYLMGQRGDAGLDAVMSRLAGGTAANADPEAQKVQRDALRQAAAAVRDRDRLQALEAAGLRDDSEADPQFDRHARLAAQVLNAPVALVSFVDSNREVFRGCVGLPEPWASQREAPLSHSFCQHAVASREPLIVDDARQHPVLRDNLGIRDLGVVAYAGVPLIDSGGQALGALCVIDSRPRQWTSHQIKLLEDLAASVVSDVSLARAAREAAARRSS